MGRLPCQTFLLNKRTILQDLALKVLWLLRQYMQVNLYCSHLTIFIPFKKKILSHITRKPSRQGKRYKITALKCERVKMLPWRLIHRQLPTPLIHSFTPNGPQIITSTTTFYKLRLCLRGSQKCLKILFLEENPGYLCSHGRGVRSSVRAGSRCRDPGTQSSLPFRRNSRSSTTIVEIYQNKVELFFSTIYTRLAHTWSKPPLTLASSSLQNPAAPRLPACLLAFVANGVGFSFERDK